MMEGAQRTSRSTKKSAVGIAQKDGDIGGVDMAK
jgi:hypothetical protein